MATNQPSESPDQPCQESFPGLTRRQVLGICSSCALAGAATAPGTQAAWGDPIPIGTLKDFAVDEISEKHIQHNFFVTRHQGRLFATTATCPHKGNYLFRNPENPKQIICSGHDAIFDPQGRPLGGPVHRGLERFGIAVDDKGTVRVDPNKQFPEDRWNDQGSYIPLKEKA